jgi:hypothetical protein
VASGPPPSCGGQAEGGRCKDKRDPRDGPQGSKTRPALHEHEMEQRLEEARADAVGEMSQVD